MKKSSVDEIRQRFDNDVERFSNLATGQSATIDAPLVLDLIADTVGHLHADATSILDVGCGAGNYSLKLLQRLPNVKAVTLVDLSAPMLETAQRRLDTIAGLKPHAIAGIQGDIREINIGENTHDVIVAAAVLHHLRTNDEWLAVFRKLYESLKPGGSIWISDLIQHSISGVQEVMWAKYGDYLAELKDAEYRDHVFAYIEKEDSPKPLMFQIDCLREVGFRQVEVLHKNSCFAAFGGLKL